MALIFVLSAQSTFPLPRMVWDDLYDIAGHLGVYGVLAVLLQWALAGTGVRRPGLWAFVLAVLYGISDEFHQSFVPGRHPDIFDVATDAVGAWAALRLLNGRLEHADSHDRPKHHL
jgi:VanZ family protein